MASSPVCCGVPMVVNASLSILVLAHSIKVLKRNLIDKCSACEKGFYFFDNVVPHGGVEVFGGSCNMGGEGRVMTVSNRMSTWKGLAGKNINPGINSF